ncbi:hypothetical protein SASPL_147448 [Salvia splendens]|uniref:Flotillin-like n=1 Tax=Salvia splendens TaxID=180675 RepID=A0A8X8Z6M8_SALSN|nr:hypothetical protein SASPL_147448 [Salvia splendens]
MSAEKLPLIIHVVFTITPHADDRDSLLKYAKLKSSRVTELVEGVIKGETRALVASIFKGTKQEVFDKVQFQLNQFGLLIYNANVQGHKYFSYLGQNVQMEATNQARIDVAEAKMKGEEAEANAQLPMKKVGWVKEPKIAQVESKKAVAICEVVERMSALTTTTNLKAYFAYETTVQEAKRQTESCISLNLNIS